MLHVGTRLLAHFLKEICMTTLASLKEALGQPFAVEHIQFLPKAIQQNQKRQWICLAHP